MGKYFIFGDKKEVKKEKLIEIDRNKVPVILV